ncbi:hypothetical protein AAFF_G00378590 [Aldrovandia affinis]|uniref:Integrase p58-like C-terminal domain-containing protein n=1 Tax=Aldrovandia affinis TaxID=143900 RepID=A0AAD7SFU2_9TELE|nr:hypothetical protein AAFF_G00378590 [Aldrovandia affinis]
MESSHCTPASLSCSGVDLVSPPPEPEVEGGPEVDHLRRLQERLKVIHDFTRQAQARSGIKQKRAYDRVWIFCPSQTKGVSPKLRSSWRRPGEVLQRLSDIVYRVRMSGRGWEVVLHQDRLAPYRPLAQAAAEAAGESPRPLSPRDSLSAPGGGRRSTPRRCRAPPHLNDYVLDSGVAGDS